jgi:hypothetical protein
MAAEGYAYQNFMMAVDGMATGVGGIRGRLADAYKAHVVMLFAEDFGDTEDRADFEFIKGALTTTSPAGSEGSVEASVAAMSDEECREVAKRIVKLRDSLQEKDALRGK